MNRIKQLRKSKGNLTQEKLAKIIGVSKRTIIAWEKDERQIRRDKVKELAKYFDVPISYLLGYSDDVDELDTFLELSKDNSKDEFNFIKSQMLSLIDRKTLNKIESKYSTQKSNLTTNKYNDLLRSLDILRGIDIRESDEAQLLIWFASLDDNDKNMILNLVESLSRKNN